MDSDLLERQKQLLGKHLLLLLSGPDSHFKRFLKNNSRAVKTLLPTDDHKLIFAAEIHQTIKKDYLEKYTRYYLPATDNESLRKEFSNLTSSDAVKIIADSLGIGQEQLPCLCFLDFNGELITVPVSLGDNLSTLLQEVKRLYDESKPAVKKGDPDDDWYNNIKFKKVIREPDAIAREAALEREMYNLSKSVLRKLKSFDKPDVLNLFIEALSKEALNALPVSLSMLKIDYQHRIFLTDFGTQIKLTPLQKTVYFLFLNHPEGIRFCDLPVYKGELNQIYKNLNNSSAWGKTTKSIDELANPHTNSMSEKISKIRSAFLVHHDIKTLEPYLINGERGGAKKIEIDREMVLVENPESFWKF